MSFVFSLGPLELEEDELCFVLMGLNDEGVLNGDACPVEELGSRLKSFCEPLGPGSIGISPELRPLADLVGLPTRALRESERAVFAAQAWCFSQLLEPARADIELVMHLVSGVMGFIDSRPWELFDGERYLFLEIEEPNKPSEYAVLTIAGPDSDTFGVMLFFGDRAQELLESDRAHSISRVSMMHLVAEPEWALLPLDAAFGLRLMPMVLNMQDQEALGVTEASVAVLAATLKALEKLTKGRQIARAEVLDSKDQGTLVQVSMHPRPVVASPGPEVSTRASAMKKVGRNDPCPCGSQKKFKKCCLNKQNPNTARPKPKSSNSIDWRDEVVELIKRRDPGMLERWITRVYGGKCSEDEMTPPFLSCFLSAFKMREGLTGAEAYLKKKGPKLPIELRKELNVLQRACLSVWEVVAIERNVGIHLWNRLSGECVFVQDKAASMSVRMHACVLARVVEEDSNYFIDVVDGRTLSPREFAPVLRAIRRELKERKNWMDPARLMEEETMAEILKVWHLAFYQKSPEPKLRCLNSDQELAHSIQATYRVKRGRAKAVVDRLLEHPDVRVDENDGSDGFQLVLVAEPDREKFWACYMRARLVVMPETFLVESIGEARSRELRGWIEEWVGSDLAFESETVESCDDPEPPTRDLVVEQVFVHSFIEVDVERLQRVQLRRSLYQPHALLGGECPVDAVKRAASRRKVHMLLGEMEYNSRGDESELFELLRLSLNLDERGEKLKKAARANRLKEASDISGKLLELMYEVLLQIPDSKQLLAVGIAAVWVWNVAPLDSDDLDELSFEAALQACLEEISERCESKHLPDTETVATWMRKMWGCRWMYPEDNLVKLDSVQNSDGRVGLRLLRSPSGARAR